MLLENPNERPATEAIISIIYGRRFERPLAEQRTHSLLLTLVTPVFLFKTPDTCCPYERTFSTLIRFDSESHVISERLRNWLTGKFSPTVRVVPSLCVPTRCTSQRCQTQWSQRSNCRKAGFKHVATEPQEISQRRKCKYFWGQT